MLTAWRFFELGQGPVWVAVCAAVVLVFVLVLLLALSIDARWGEPRPAYHPVVLMGRYLKICGDRISACSPPVAFVGGALAWLAGALFVGVLAAALQALVLRQVTRLVLEPALDNAGIVALLVIFIGWLLKCMLSWRMLHDEVGAVETALQQSLDGGRARLARLVSRNTALLNESEMRESAIESLAENLNDSVVAPVFWFVLLGLPGAAIYRFANTADSMWGYRGVYRGQHWEWAGKWAARADDVLSWLPARLTAGLIALVARGVPMDIMRWEAAKTPSPNSGWPMAAMALALDVRLRKPGVYTLNASGRPAEAEDTALAQRYGSKAVFSLVLSAQAAMFLIAIALVAGLFPW